MKPQLRPALGPFGLSSGDAALLSILGADFFGTLAGALVHLTMVWWVLSQGVSGPTVSLLVLCIFLPLNIGVLLTGVAVDRFGSRSLLIWSKLIATCGALACFAITALQEQMPVSLQAQAIGIWEFLVLSVGSVAILLTGFTGAWSLPFIVAIAAASVLGAVYATRQQEAGHA